MYVAALPGCGASTAIARPHAAADHDNIRDIPNSSSIKVPPTFRKGFSVGRNKPAPLQILPIAVPGAELPRRGKRLGEFAPSGDLQEGAPLPNTVMDGKGRGG
jgi:hypothetical protein